MKLMDIISARSFILNHRVENEEYLWNDVYNLLIANSTSIPDEKHFIRAIKRPMIFKPKVNLKSIFVHLQIKGLQKETLLLIRFKDKIEVLKGRKINYLYVLVTSPVTKTNDHGMLEFLKIYNSVSLESILDKAVDPINAFHLIKQFLNFTDEYEDINKEFDIFGTEEE